jgi:hypothetical protein
MPSFEQVARGHEEPFAVQFSIFLANRVGQLKEMLDVFISRSVQVLGMSIVDSTNWAVIRIICSDPDKARELLKAHPLPFTESEVLLIEVESDHALSDVASCLLRAEISVHFAYPLTIRRDDVPVMVFHVDDTVLACRTLTNHGFVLLGHEDLADPASGES